ncbi:MAG: FAD-dependent oxidoreductase [Actinomycetota bacterium]|nr:MAG: oxidoreductase FAD/NAD(P)-binding domain-containing [Actinomycetota bacterium]MDO8949371.1 FAD-dependent oxidoreductase [Actinomycetota bacterium]MDP3629378.1 FAD-dependent oxidoreductase [Actinomycetota bacterium]
MSAGEYEVVFIGRTDCGEGVATFRFSRPEGYDFKPGQFFMLTLDTRDGVVSKPFSHADAPDDPAIELTTRLTGSAFKDALLALEPGAAVSVSGPKGRLAVPDDARAIGFLAGGIGITPAHSIIRHAVLRKSDLSITLFYGNRDETCIPYGEEFRGYATSVPGFAYVETLDHPGPDWSGASGFISAELVRANVDDPVSLHWIVAGPPPMVEAMRKVVDDLGLAHESVSYEVFAGYK